MRRLKDGKRGCNEHSLVALSSHEAKSNVVTEAAFAATLGRADEKLPRHARLMLLYVNYVALYKA